VILIRSAFCGRVGIKQRIGSSGGIVISPIPIDGEDCGMWERVKLTCLYLRAYATGYIRICFPVVLWLAVAWYFDFSLMVTLLVFIAVNLNGLGVALQMIQAQAKDTPTTVVKRDFYVVIDTNYQWNILKGPRRDMKPDTLDSAYSFDSFEAAKAMYEAVSREHYPNEDQLPWLEYPDSYMDGSEYTEYEARLWVIPATSKAEALDQAYYHDSRRLLGFGSGPTVSHLVLITNNEKRRQGYKTWWQQRMEYLRYLDSREAYLREHPDVVPGFVEPLDFEQWSSFDAAYMHENALPGRPSRTKTQPIEPESLV
jgi:hypothetical protein